MQTIREKLTFTNADGRQLAALLEKPYTTPKAYAIFAHCFAGSKTLGIATGISRALAAKKFAVMRFDFTGLGNSEGDFANTNFSSNVSDLLSAAGFLKTHYAPADLLIGHSLGGAAVLAAAAKMPECEAVATIGAPADPKHVSRLFAGHWREIETEGRATVELAGRRFTITKQFLDDIKVQAQRQRIANLRKALLILHSPVDEVVEIDNAAQIFKAAKHPKSFISLDQADHMLTDPRDVEFAADTIAVWARRYVINKLQAKSIPRPVLTDNEVRVEETGSPYTNAIYTSEHQLVADEPAPTGNDLGPDPYRLLLAALGACTSMTLRMYAQRKNLPLEKVSVRLRHRKVHARDCEDCLTQDEKLDHIRREIILDGELDAVQRQRLLEIAEKCPVHKTLDQGAEILTELATDRESP